MDTQVYTFHVRTAVCTRVWTLLFSLDELSTVHFVCYTLLFWLDMISYSFYNTCLAAELSF